MWRARGKGLIPGLMLALALTAVVAACGQAQHNTPTLPGGTYTSATYHFSVTYPQGWSISASLCGAGEAGGNSCDSLGTATVASGQTVAIPLQLTITQTSQRSTTAASVSTFAVTVLNLSDANMAQAAAGLATDASLHKTTISGLSGYVSTPEQQSLPGPNGTPSAQTDTHTDYYLVHGGYEYQISIDALSGDGAEPALTAMLQSFTITA